MRIALLSNVTADLLKGMLEERGHGVWLPEGWNAPVQTALSPPAALREFDPQLVAFLVDGTHAQVDEKDVAAAVAGARGEFPRARVEGWTCVRSPKSAGTAFSTRGCGRSRRCPGR